MTDLARSRWTDVERIVADDLRFKRRLRIGEDAYALRRLIKEAFRWWDSAGMASTGVTAAKSAVVASTFFAPAAPTGIMAFLGLATPAVAVTPVGWVIAAAVLAGGGHYGITRWLAAQPDDAVDVIPKWLNTATDQLGAALFDLLAGLALLIAAADREIAEAERAAITGHLVSEWGFDAAFVAVALPVLEAELNAKAVEASARALTKYLAASPDCHEVAIANDLLTFLRDLMMVDGYVDPAERAAIERIAAIFAESGRWSVAQLTTTARNAATTLATASRDAVGHASTMARSSLATAAGSMRSLAGKLSQKAN